MQCHASLAMHLARGPAALLSLIGAVGLSQFHWLGSLLAAVGAIAALGGCPLCWLTRLMYARGIGAGRARILALRP